jgi:hypothetical protein
MSDNIEQHYRYRRFCKIIGLHSVFNNSKDNFYNTTNLDETKSNEFCCNLSNPELLITKDTILFITADSKDKDKKIKISSVEFNENGDEIKTIETTKILSEFDTMLWVNGNIYSLSQKNVKAVSYNDREYKLEIIYSDNSKQPLDISGAQKLGNIDVIFPLCKYQETDTDDDGKKIYHNTIQLFGQEKDDSGRNFVIGMYEDEKDTPSEYNNTYNNLNYTTIIGKGNIASTNGQIILGNFNEESTNSKFVVCNGNSNSDRKNLFTVSNDGDVLAMNDFVLSNETNQITHKLSDIHSVVDDDWMMIGI